MQSQIDYSNLFNSAPFLDLLRLAINEDLGNGDITTDSIVSKDLVGRARIYAKADLVVCGNMAVKQLFHHLDPEVSYRVMNDDGALIKAGETIALVQGRSRMLLSSERVALNLIQRLSGIASTTKKYVAAVTGTNVRILDTRKTTPGHRLLEKYAVAIGGGCNHRFGLYDAVLIKNNHIDSLGGDIREAIRRARNGVPSGIKVQVEIRDIGELRQAMEESVDAILLDNMLPEKIAEAVKMIRASKNRSAEIEASGGITLNNIRDYALSGVDSISIGALTHSAPAIDIAMEILPI